MYDSKKLIQLLDNDTKLCIQWIRVPEGAPFKEKKLQLLFDAEGSEIHNYHSFVTRKTWE